MLDYSSSARYREEGDTGIACSQADRSIRQGLRDARLTQSHQMAKDRYAHPNTGILTRTFRIPPSARPLWKSGVCDYTRCETDVRVGPRMLWVNFGNPILRQHTPTIHSHVPLPSSKKQSPLLSLLGFALHRGICCSKRRCVPLQAYAEPQ